MADKLQPARPSFTGTRVAPGQVQRFDFEPAGKTAMDIPARRIGPVRPAMVTQARAFNPPGAVMNNLHGLPAFGAAGQGMGRVSPMGSLSFAPSPNWPSMNPRFPQSAGSPNIPSRNNQIPMWVRYTGNVAAMGGFGSFGSPSDARAVTLVKGSFAEAAKEANKSFFKGMLKDAGARYAGRSSNEIYADGLYMLKFGKAYKTYARLAAVANAVDPKKLSAPTGSSISAGGGTRTVSDTSVGAVLRTGAGWREVQGSGGYVYRQYRNGKITVVSGPALVGTSMTESSDARRWTAITAEIGDYSRSSSGIISLLPSVASALQAFAPVSSSAATDALDPGGAMSIPQVPTGPSATTIALYAGGGLLGVVALVALVKAISK